MVESVPQNNSNVSSVEIELLKMNSAKAIASGPSPWFKLAMFLSCVAAIFLGLSIGLAVWATEESAEVNVISLEVPVALEPGRVYRDLGINVCHDKKLKHADPTAEDNYFANQKCMVDGVVAVLEQAGANVTEGYVGKMKTAATENLPERIPINESYYKRGLCPVNVHWHLGAEHLSVGQYDEKGKSPLATPGSSYGDQAKLTRKLLAGANVREGFTCHHYDKNDAKFTKPYAWKHCKDMVVGQTYEVHWPHSAAGACGTPNQYQTPFYDGVFCMPGIISLSPLNTFEKIGVQAQVFTIVNDEDYYYPDLMRGMIVDGDHGTDMAYYTGSTTGTSRDNDVCSKYTPITWQVDRKCHMISASTFDKMCADMKAQRDDMTGDLHAHGSRKLVADHLAADNQKYGK